MTDHKNPRTWFEKLLNWLPTNCPLCGLSSYAGKLCSQCEHDSLGARQSRLVCFSCAEDLSGSFTGFPIVPSNEGLRCVRCRNQAPLVKATICALDYAFPGKLLVNNFKEGRQLALAPVLADLMRRAAHELLMTHPVDVWVPIPASHQRLLDTGFSPAQQLAKELSALTRIPCRWRWLQLGEGDRVQKFNAQKSLSQNEHQDLSAQTYEADPAVRGLRIGVVDDIVATGATIHLAATALIRKQVREVIALAAAKSQVSVAKYGGSN